MVSRAPLDKLEDFKRRMGWTMPWYSSFGQDFNYDFHVSEDESVGAIEYNYDDKAALEKKGHVWRLRGEQPGLSVFYTEGGDVYHSYSAYARGFESVLSTYSLLDMTPLGRQESGMVGITTFPLHDQY